MKPIHSKGNPFSALRYPNFRLFWSGRAVSLIGSWVQRASQSWLVLQMTQSPFKLGLVNAAQFLPYIFLSLYAGVLIDRVPKRTVVLWTQIGMTIQALILAFLVYTNTIQYWHILCLALLQGICTAFDNPARQSMISDLVPREDVLNAVSLNSAIVNGARIIGPAIGGLAMDFFGAALSFLINAISFLFVIAALLAMKMPVKAASSKPKNTIRDIKEGLSYAVKTPTIRNVLGMVSLTSMFALNLNVLIPVFASQVLNMSATGYGILMSSMGAGAVLGAVVLASLSYHGPQTMFIYLGASLVCILEMTMILPQTFITASIVMFFIGLTQIAYSATCNSTLQLTAPDHLRGRVMSLYSMLNGGVTPFGNTIAGAITEFAGVGIGFFFCGFCGLFCSLFLYNQQRKHSNDDPLAADD
ncbi:MAG TPA: MFS transporter [Bacillota bacterium]|nr:MFS transporter [Bacillota bacterium]